MGLVQLKLKRMPHRSAVTQVMEPFQLVAPVGGLNFRDPLAAANPKDAYLLSNFIARPYGCELRAGYKRHFDRLPAPPGTLMPYNAPVLLDSRLFAACTDHEVYNVTDPEETTTPIPAVSIPGQLDPGRMSWTNFSTTGTNYLCVVGAGGGYWTYDTVGGWVDHPTGAATTAGNVEFPASDTTTVDDFDFIIQYKNRLWFVKKGSGEAYYLPVGVVAGLLERFDFGPMFLNGGQLEMLASWSATGGAGIDDKLVVYGSGGDLIVYEGDDPTDATLFRVAARWFLGKPPVGRRFMDRYGGDLFILTERGISSLNDLIRHSFAEEEFTLPYSKVSQRVGRMISTTLAQPGWEVRYFTTEQIVVINAPRGVAVDDYTQFCMDVNSKGWSTFESMPSLTMQEFGSNLFFGGPDGIIYTALTSPTDDELVDGTPGGDLQGELQTVWQALGSAPYLKIAQMAKMFFQATEAPSIQSKINFEFSSTAAAPGSPAFAAQQVDLWDASLWEQAVWSGASNTYQIWQGMEGMGYFAALRLRVRGVPRTVFTNWLLLATRGGVM